ASFEAGSARSRLVRQWSVRWIWYKTSLPAGPNEIPAGALRNSRHDRPSRQGLSGLIPHRKEYDDGIIWQTPDGDLAWEDAPGDDGQDDFARNGRGETPRSDSTPR